MCIFFQFLDQVGFGDKLSDFYNKSLDPKILSLQLTNHFFSHSCKILQVPEACLNMLIPCPRVTCPKDPAPASLPLGSPS